MDNKSKLTILYTSIGIFILFICLLVFSIYKNRLASPQTHTATLSPTTMPSISSTINISQKGAIVNSMPANFAQQVPLNTHIVLSFESSINTTEISLITTPKFSFNRTDNNGTITLIPAVELSPSTQYSIVSTYPSSPNPVLSTLTFTTIGPTPPGSSSSENVKESNQFYLTHHPDVFLYNQCPYTGQNFSISATLDSNGNPIFTVTSMGGANIDAEKQGFLNWAESLGLTASQIQSFNLTYQ